MYIKNKFLRFIASVIITIVLYYILVLILSFDYDRSFGNIIEGMVVFAVFGLFIVGPTLIFMVYLSYQLLTTKSERSKKAPKIIKNTLLFIGIMALLYVAAMYTDLFG